MPHIDCTINYFQLEVYLKNLAVVIQGAFAMMNMVQKQSVVVRIQEVNHHINLIASKIAKRKKKKKKGTKVITFRSIAMIARCLTIFLTFPTTKQKQLKCSMEIIR